MKRKHFYTHLIQVNDIVLDLGDLDMTQEERVHLLALLDANIHSTVVHTVLSELPNDEKKAFLENIIVNDHEKTWNHLRLNSVGLEDKIRIAVEKLVKEMKQDIKLVKSQNKK